MSDPQPGSRLREWFDQHDAAIWLVLWLGWIPVLGVVAVVLVVRSLF